MMAGAHLGRAEISMALQLLPLGVGDAFSALHYSSCLALGAEGAWLLIDCPHPIRKIVREAARTAGLALDVDALSAVALTHLHADHSSGIEGLAYFARYALGRRLPLLAHPAVSARLWEGHLAAGMEQLVAAPGAPPEPHGLADYIDLQPLSFEHPTRFGPFSIECRTTIHHIPTTAFRIHAGGRTIGHSADTSYDPSLIEWLAPCDLIVHETNHGLHTPYEKLAALPAPLRARMRLTHYPDELDLAASAIEPLLEGRLLVV